MDGLKTYAVIGVAVIAAILGYFNGQLTLIATLEAIGLAIGLGGNRAVIYAGQVLNGPYTPRGDRPSTTARQLVTYLGVALTILTALVAGLNGEQEPAVVIAAILGALGVNFLGLGAKKAADGKVVAPPARV